MNTLLMVLAALAGGEAVIDFDTEVVPLLTKAGCNAAACHGAAVGRGELRLSLFGGDGEADYHSLVHDAEGRRVNLARPRESLVIKKPALELDHGGEQRFEFDSPEAELLAAWISQGAQRRELRKLVSLSVEPAEIVVESVPAEHDLRVTAEFDDGLARNVTREAVYLVSDETGVSVDDSGRVTILRRGRHTVIVRFLSQLATVQITAPLSDQRVSLNSLPVNNWIDEEINASLASLGLPASPPADDAAFLRRATLDFTGRLPTLKEVREFVASEDPQKRESLVERLLASVEFTDYWAHQLAKLLRIRAADPAAAKAFHLWVRQCVAEGTPYDEMARTLLVAEGDSHEYGPANFHRIAAGAREQAEYVSELFLAARLRCANCHNHPLDRWTQDDYHGLAAIFARIDRGRHVRLLPRGEVTNPATGKAAVPRLPGERFLGAEEDGRQSLADWLTSNDNPYFAAAVVNRLWKSLMGRGLIEPTDDLRATNPATHPQLLRRLADDFAAHGYDLRHTLRLIAGSAAYGRSSAPAAATAMDDRFYSHAMARSLPPEVLLDAICDVTGVWETYGDLPPGTRAIELIDAGASSESLDALGRCSREASCEEAVLAGGLSTRLHLLNGPLVNAKIASPSGRLHASLNGGSSNEEIVREFYLRALGREPSAGELSWWRSELPASETRERRTRLEDFVWGLMNSREFTTNH
jgi:hypothetical protein